MKSAMKKRSAIEKSIKTGMMTSRGVKKTGDENSLRREWLNRGKRNRKVGYVTV
jgi:hypothetical protein